MALTIQLPQELEQSLRKELGNLDEVAKEAMLVELYRQDKLTQHELSLALGITRLEVEALLKKHKVIEDLPNLEEYEAALTRLREMTAD
jgi:hypothetical protein